MQKSYNFSNPLYGRKWLRWLRDDPISGIRIQPDLRLGKRELGFTFASNSLGLRGPADLHAPNVVLGTSFAMGFAVDNGLNWYENCLEGAWLNLGLPVGVRQAEALLSALYQGEADTALVLYHPNLWSQTQVFELIRSRSQQAIEGMGWQTRLLPCLKLALRRWRWHAPNRRAGKLLVFRTGGRRYEIDTLYSKVDLAANPSLAPLVLETQARMLARFRRVIVIRTLVKQELVPERFQNDLLRSTIQNYNTCWHLYQERLSAHPNIRFLGTEGFSLQDFFPQDNHWSPQGNEKFARLVTQALAE